MLDDIYEAYFQVFNDNFDERQNRDCFRHLWVSRTPIAFTSPQLTRAAFNLLSEFDYPGYPRLASAAPDLLDALEHALSIYGKFDALINDPNDPGGWVMKARAAVEKARGE